MRDRFCLPRPAAAEAVRTPRSRRIRVEISRQSRTIEHRTPHGRRQEPRKCLDGHAAKLRVPTRARAKERARRIGIGWTGGALMPSVSWRNVDWERSVSVCLRFRTDSSSASRQKKCIERQVTHLRVELQLETIGQQMSQHQPYLCRRRVALGFGDNIEPV